jgi:hypothetical protein
MGVALSGAGQEQSLTTDCSWEGGRWATRRPDSGSVERRVSHIPRG